MNFWEQLNGDLYLTTFYNITSKYQIKGQKKNGLKQPYSHAIFGTQTKYKSKIIEIQQNISVQLLGTILWAPSTPQHSRTTLLT